MTTSYRTLLERSQHDWRRIYRKPAGDFHQFIADPRQAKGQRWPLLTLRWALGGGFSTNRES